MVYGIVVAGGQGTRLGMKKQYVRLLGQPLWSRSTEALLAGGVKHVWLVVPAEDVETVTEQVNSGWPNGIIRVVAGGHTRFESVRNGLTAILEHVEPGENHCVAVHDAARPFVLPQDVANVIAVAQRSGGAILAQRCADTVKQVHEDAITSTVPREHLWLAQTPQAFSLERMSKAYFLNHAYDEATDDASVMELAGYTVQVVEAGGENRKITTRQDLAYAEWMAQQRWGGNP